jgi:hypothetical protein
VICDKKHKKRKTREESCRKRAKEQRNPAFALLLCAFAGNISRAL